MESNRPMESEKSVSQLRLDNKITHHWQIEPANGRTSKGKCLIHPGEIRRFFNAVEDTTETSSDPLRRRGGYSTSH